MWVTIPTDLTVRKETTYKKVSHAPGRIKGISYTVCKKCGLVYLRNDLTRLAIKLGCDNEYHPAMIRRYKR